MAHATAEEVIARSPEDILEFVMDVRRYAEVDDKLGTIDWVHRDGDLTEFQFRGALPGLPAASQKNISQMRLTPGERIDIRLAPPPRNRLAHLVSTFAASFACTPVSGGTRLTRTISVDLVAPLRWFAEPILRRRLPVSVEREVRLTKQALERG